MSFKGCKKLVSVSATSTPITETREKAVEVIKTAGAGKDSEGSKDEYPKSLAQVPYIRYPITFQKKFVPMSALFDSGSEVNAIYPIFVQKLGLPIRLMDVGAQKIEGTILDTYEMIVTAFLIMGKANQVRFFETTFLVANVSPEVVFGMLFLTLSGVNIDFLVWELR